MFGGDDEGGAEAGGDALGEAFDVEGPLGGEGGVAGWFVGEEEGVGGVFDDGEVVVAGYFYDGLAASD